MTVPLPSPLAVNIPLVLDEIIEPKLDGETLQAAVTSEVVPSEKVQVEENDSLLPTRSVAFKGEALIVDAVFGGTPQP